VNGDISEVTLKDHAVTKNTHTFELAQAWNIFRSCEVTYQAKLTKIGANLRAIGISRVHLVTCPIRRKYSHLEESTTLLQEEGKDVSLSEVFDSHVA